MKFYAVIAVAAMLSLSVLVVVSPASYAFKAYNVNLNRTIDLPIELAYPKTTIQPGYPSCGTDTFETIHIAFETQLYSSLCNLLHVIAISVRLTTIF
jgi:hypothetical protein